MKNIFVIVNYNDYENTYKLIKNIEEYKIIDQIIVVDNCSTNDSYEKLNKINNAKIKIIKTKKNKGYGYAINYAAKYCDEKYKECNLIISNSDIQIKKEEDLKELIDYINEKKDIAIIAPKINQNGIISLGWKIPTVMEAIILNIPKINKYYEKKYIMYNEKEIVNTIKTVEVVSGCFFVIKLSSLKKINYFDENVFLYYEENIISTKLKKINQKIVINPDIEVIHNHSLTINKNLSEYNKLKELKKSQYYFYKNVLKSNKILLYILKITNVIILRVKKAKVGTKD